MNKAKNLKRLSITNIPNIITFLRIVLLPPALYLFMKNSFILNTISLILVIIMEFSDFLDGYLARKMNKMSDAGKVLDPFADHIYRLSFFLFFFVKGFIPLWMFLICFYRDSLVLNLRIFASKNENKFIAARASGKIKAIVQSIVIMSIILLNIMNYKIEIININKLYYLLMFIATAVTFWSAIDYFIGTIKVMRKLQPLE